MTEQLDNNKNPQIYCHLIIGMEGFTTFKWVRLKVIILNAAKKISSSSQNPFIPL